MDGLTGHVQKIFDLIQALMFLPPQGLRVLVVRLSSLGDIILTTPVYAALKTQWPDCHVSVLTLSLIHI